MGIAFNSINRLTGMVGEVLRYPLTPPAGFQMRLVISKMLLWLAPRIIDYVCRGWSTSRSKPLAFEFASFFLFLIIISYNLSHIPLPFLVPDSLPHPSSLCGAR